MAAQARFQLENKLSTYFNCHTENYTDGAFDVHQSITAVLPYQSISFEELRLRDYSLGGAPAPITHQPSHMSLTLQQTAHLHTAPGLRRNRNSIVPITSPTTIIRVGGEVSTATDFVLQQEVLARQSDFFKAALKKEWAKRSAEDATTVIISMPADYPKVFSIYAEWLYSGAIYSINNTEAGEIDTEFKELALAYILGEKLIDRTFKNAIVDAFVEKVMNDRTIDPALPVLVYDNTPSPSPLRRLLVDTYVQHGGPSLVTMDRSTAHLAPDFLIELNVELYNKQGSPATGPIWMQPVCARYHEHGKTDFVPCQRRTVMPKYFHPRQHSV